MVCETCKIIISDSSKGCPRCSIYLQAEDLSLETPVKVEKQKTLLFCPKCGAAHTLTAQFCRNDGTPLKESFSKNSKKEAPLKSNKDGTNVFNVTKGGENLKKNSKTLRWVAVLSLAFLLTGSGIYLYFSINKKLKTDNPTVISKNTNNTSFNGQINPTDNLAQNQNTANLLLTPQNVDKSTVDIARLEVEINRALRKKGIHSIYVEVNTDLSASITGMFNNKRDRQRTLNLLASYKELTGLRFITSDKAINSQVNVSKLSDQINNALRDAGIKGVIVEVNDALQVTLKGAVSSKEEKNKAFEIVRLFKEAKRIKDLVFIVES